MGAFIPFIDSAMVIGSDIGSTPDKSIGLPGPEGGRGSKC
jgi:hypothetical protein